MNAPVKMAEPITDPRHAQLDTLFRTADKLFNGSPQATAQCKPFYMAAFRLRDEMRADGLTIAPEYDDQKNGGAQ